MTSRRESGNIVSTLTSIYFWYVVHNHSRVRREMITLTSSSHLVQRYFYFKFFIDFSSSKKISVIYLLIFSFFSFLFRCTFWRTTTADFCQKCKEEICRNCTILNIELRRFGLFYHITNLALVRPKASTSEISRNIHEEAVEAMDRLLGENLNIKLRWEISAKFREI